MVEVAIPQLQEKRSTMSHTSGYAGSFRLTPDEVHCWGINLDVSPGACTRYYKHLGKDERHRSDRFRFRRDRQRFIVAHGVLRELLAHYLHTRPGRISYAYNVFGKPDLSPEFGNRLKFNLSHSASHALVAIAADSNVGVDLEFIRTQEDYVEIARHFFPAGDVDYLEGLPNHLRAEAFFSSWTRIEACVKACGKGLANLDGAGGDIIPPNCWSLYALRPAPGYIGALVIKGSGRRLALRHWADVC